MSIINTIKNKVLAGCVAVTEFKHNKKGVTAVEYAVVVAGVTAIVLVIFGRNGTVHQMLTTIFSEIQTNVVSGITKQLDLNQGGNGGGTNP